MNARRPWMFLAGLVACLLLCLGCARLDTDAPPSQSLTVLHFNDFHGQLEPYSDPQSASSAGGIARLAGEVRRARAEARGRPVLLLFGGDMLQGTLTSSLFLGWPDMDLFNAMGVDAAVMGNHELDYGQARFRALVAQARFPLLAANLHSAPPPFGVRPYVLLQPAGGPRVAVLGLTTADLATTTLPRNAAGITMDNPVEVAKAWVPDLIRQSDLLVVLSHLGIAEDRRLAREVPGIDLIVGGHNHLAFQAPVQENGTLIVQAGERGRYLGRLDLTVQAHAIQHADYRLIPVDERSPVDEGIGAQVKAWAARADVQAQQVIGRASVLLDGRREVVRRQESNLGDLVADLARERTGAQVALFNGGSFRASIPAGEVRIKDLYEVFPFRNQLVTGRMTGAQLQAALDQSAAYAPQDNPGGFLQVSGLRYAIADGKAVDVTVGGAPLEPEATYTVVVPDFLAAGGDGYASVRDMSDKVETGQLISDMLIASFRAGKALAATPDQRIVRR